MTVRSFKILWDLDLKSYRSLLLFILTLCFAGNLSGQKAAYCSSSDFEDEIASYLNFSVALISVHEMNQLDDNFLLLDARELEEYQMSHIKNASHIGFEKPQLNLLDNVDKDKTIIVYCSIGYRSEKIGEKIQDLGFSKVFNLYGSIFEWSNAGFPIFNEKGEETSQLHTYNRKWSKWVNNDNIDKKW